MNRLLKMTASVLLGAALITSQIGTAPIYMTASAASTSDPSTSEPVIVDKIGKPTVLGYSVTDSRGKTLKSISKGKEFTLTINVMDRLLKSSDISETDIVFTKSMGFFECGAATVKKTSTVNNKPLQYTITVEECEWTGEERNFDFMLGYLSLGNDFSDLSFTISECPEKKPDPTPSPSTNYAEPILKVSAEDAEEIQPGQEGSFSLDIKNLGSSDAYGMLVEISSSDDIIIVDGTDSQDIGYLWAGESETLNVKYKALNKINSAKQTFNITLRYYYDNGSGDSVGTTTASVNIPAKASSNVPGSAEPLFKITPSDITEIKSGESGYFTLTLKNLGSVSASRILVETAASDDTLLTEGSGSQDIAMILPNNGTSVKINYKALSKINSPKQTFNISVKYYYDNGSGETIGNASYSVNIPSLVSAADITAPTLRISGQTLNVPIKSDAEYEYTLTLRNFSDIPAENITMFLDASDALYFIEGTETATIEHIDAKGTAEVKIKFRTVDHISAVKQGITAHINFTYNDGESDKTAETESAITVIASASEGSGGSGAAVPNIIIKSYDIGAEQIAAGDAFDLKLDLFNTSTALGVENVVMTINAGNGINIYGGGNTFYYAAIGAGAGISETVPLKAPATAETGTSSVSVSLKYDYINGETRETATFEQTIFIPVYQPDKMTFEVSVPTYAVQAGMETYITTTYMNKGRSDISNVKAEIVGEVDALSTSKVIGTVQPGGNGSFDFIVMPSMAGPCEFVIKVTYEDATLTEVTKELPVSFNVEEMMFPDDPGMMDPGMMDPGMMEPGEEEGGFPWVLLWIGIGVLVVGGIVTIIIVVNVKKKKKNAVSAADFDWDDEFEDPKPSNSSNNNNNNSTTV